MYICMVNVHIVLSGKQHANKLLQFNQLLYLYIGLNKKASVVNMYLFIF